MSIVFGQLINGLNSATCEIDPSTAATYQDGINSKILLIVYVGIAYFALIYIHTICWNVFSESLAQRIREAYFSAILRQDAAFFDNLPAGEVAARITDAISVVQQGTNEKVGIVISSVSFVITAHVVAVIKNPKLAGMLVSLTPAYLIMALGGGYFVQKYVGHSMSTMAKASSVALEAISNTMVVHTFSANARFEEKFVEVLTPALWAGVTEIRGCGIAGWSFVLHCFLSKCTFFLARIPADCQRCRVEYVEYRWHYSWSHIHCHAGSHRRYVDLPWLIQVMEALLKRLLQRPWFSAKLLHS
jgi:hypothetical protein